MLNINKILKLQKVTMADKDRLQLEISRAKIVEHAYDTFLEDFFSSERLNIFNKFSHVNSVDGILMGIKHEQMALDNLEQTVLTEIETGRLATQMLNDLNEE